jgi:hypothetical protein
MEEVFEVIIEVRERKSGVGLAEMKTSTDPGSLLLLSSPALPCLTVNLQKALTPSVSCTDSQCWLERDIPTCLEKLLCQRQQPAECSQIRCTREQLVGANESVLEQEGTDDDKSEAANRMK